MNAENNGGTTMHSACTCRIVRTGRSAGFSSPAPPERKPPRSGRNARIVDGCGLVLDSVRWLGKIINE
jgi:hypothetical protein